MSMLSPLDEQTRKELALIIAKSGGNRIQADKAIRSLAGHDHAFLLGLVQPFLDGIVAHALSVALPPPVKSARVGSSLSPSAMDDLVKGMHRNMQAGASMAAPRTDPETHAETIRALAAAQAKRRIEER